MAPEAPVEAVAPVIDYFATDAAPAEEPAPVEELPAPAPVAPAEPAAAPAVELQAIPLMAPADPEPAPEPAAVEPVVELPAIAPQPEPVAAVEPEPIVAPAPVELAPEPAPEPVDLTPPVSEPLVAAEPVSVPALEELFAPAAKRAVDFRVVVRLKEGDGVEVGSFRDFGTAMEGAQEVIEQFSSATEGQWPFYAGRFIRPDLIVSVDVVEGGDED
jgi:hypothetical protein